MVAVPKKGDAMAEHFKEDDGLFLIPDEIDELGDTADLSEVKSEIPAKDIPKYVLPSKVYDILKWVGLVFLYALATLLGTLGTAWEWPYTTQIVTSVTAVGFFIGTCLGADEFSARRH